jgi:hypothetical protein
MHLHRHTARRHAGARPDPIKDLLARQGAIAARNQGLQHIAGSSVQAHGTQPATQFTIPRIEAEIAEPNFRVLVQSHAPRRNPAAGQSAY